MIDKTSRKNDEKWNVSQREVDKNVSFLHKTVLHETLSKYSG